MFPCYLSAGSVLSAWFRAQDRKWCHPRSGCHSSEPVKEIPHGCAHRPTYYSRQFLTDTPSRVVLYRAKTRVKLTIVLVNFWLVVNPELEGFFRLVLTYMHPKCSLTLVVERDASDMCVCSFIFVFVCMPVYMSVHVLDTCGGYQKGMSSP